MSTTTNNVKTTSANLKAAETKLAETMTALTTAGMGVVNAANEIRRIQSAIEAGDDSIQLDDLTKANAELNFYQLKQQAKARAVEAAQQAEREAKSAHVVARVESGEYGLSADALRTEGEALAQQIATMLADHKAKCEAHNAARARLMADVKEITKGGETEGAALAWGKEFMMPDWVSVNGERVRYVYDSRVETVAKRATQTVALGEEFAAEHYTL
ncbi:hypothetical protein [Paenarthrobacter sp. YIM B13468]|uniref:hypothetical protein n=1 Tax=Paenarthrobacter sp. YIM B13468 TaxID=3366295 RepID=UPI003670E346